jgi:hypothetical protein
MAKQELVEDPVLGMRYAMSWKGDVLVHDCWVDPGAFTPEHIHPTIEERFEVIEGDFLFRVEGEELRAGAGDKPVVRPGQRHGFENVGETEGHLRTEIDPGLTMQGFFEESAALARAGKYTLIGRRAVPKGVSGALAMSEFSDRYSDVTMLTSPPRILQRTLMGPLARLQRRRGGNAPDRVSA